MILSILLPSRGRVPRLKRLLENFKETATGTGFEILLRFDDDDRQSVAEIKNIEQWSVCRCIVGPRYGYTKLDSHYYAPLEDAARGQWVWEMNDDVKLGGDWLGELRAVPLSGYIVQPEISCLGGSTYPFCEGAAFPIWPRHAWKLFAEKFPEPFDREGDKLLRDNGWKTWFLPGVTVWHQRDNDQQLAAHRK